MSEDTIFMIAGTFLFGGMSVGLFGFGFRDLYRTRKFLRTCLETEGVVVRAIDHGNDEIGWSCTREISFAHPKTGKEYTFEDRSNSSRSSIEIGQRVKVLYSPENAEDAKVDSFRDKWLFGFGFILVGCFTLFFFVSILLILLGLG